MNEVMKNELAENEKQGRGNSEKVKVKNNSDMEGSLNDHEAKSSNGAVLEHDEEENPAGKSNGNSNGSTENTDKVIGESEDITGSDQNTAKESEIAAESNASVNTGIAPEGENTETEKINTLEEAAAEISGNIKDDSEGMPAETAREIEKVATSSAEIIGGDAILSAGFDDLHEEEDAVHDDAESHVELEAEAINYSSLNKEQLVELAESASKLEDLKEASETIKAIRPVFEQIIHSEYQTALQKFIEEGNTKEDFAPHADPLKEKFHNAYKVLQSRKAEYRAKVEDERQKNLVSKKQILAKLKHLTESDETRESLNEVKALQTEWKRIRAVPKEDVQELWDNYRFYLDKFYDNLSINNELKELDRRKNLEYKIELCKKVDALSEEKSIKKAMILLNKYHDEWKNTGPVPKEFSEEMWSRFKEASDKIYAQKKAVLDEMHKEWNQNLENKERICAKVEELSKFEGKNPKMWIEKTKEINSLLDEWKTIGPVSRSASQAVWNRFREASNSFYNKKNQFFKALNHEKNQNLKLKTELCEKAEALQESEDWGHATDEIKKLQEQWKKSGTVPEKQSDKIWKRFRAACDHFFQRKAERYATQEQSYTKNLEIKTGIIEKLEALQQKSAEAADENLYNELKPLQEEWISTGFVPMNKKEEINKRYNDTLNKIYNTLRSSKSNFDELKQRSHFEAVANMPNGKVKLNQEERTIADKLRLLKGEVSTWENNIEFFRNSKNADVLRKQIEDKIKSAEAQISKLNERLKIIKSVK